MSMTPEQLASVIAKAQAYLHDLEAELVQAKTAHQDRVMRESLDEEVYSQRGAVEQQLAALAMRIEQQKEVLDSLNSKRDAVAAADARRRSDEERAKLADLAHTATQTGEELLATGYRCCELLDQFAIESQAHSHVVGQATAWQERANQLDPPPNYHPNHQQADPLGLRADEKVALDPQSIRAALARALQQRIGGLAEALLKELSPKYKDILQHTGTNQEKAQTDNDSEHAIEEEQLLAAVGVK